MLRFHSGGPKIAWDHELDPDQARLVVLTPHWSACVMLIDNNLQPVRDLGKVRPSVEARVRLGRAEAQLQPGAYQVQVELNGATQAMWVALEAGHETLVPADSWNELVGAAQALPSALPESVIRRLKDLNGAPTQETHLALVATPLPAGDGVPLPFTYDLQLLDEAGDVVVNLRDDPPVAEEGRLWHWARDLKPGYYVLRMPEAGGSRRAFRNAIRHQPIYLCEGWQTLLSMKTHGAPLLATMSLRMARCGQPSSFGGDAADAADAVLAAPRQPHSGAGGAWQQAHLGVAAQGKP